MSSAPQIFNEKRSIAFDIHRYGFGTSHTIGFGENETTPEVFKELLRCAIKFGCLHIDCAPLYGTQQLVGEVLNEQMSLIPRKSFFITSKLPMNMMRGDEVERSFHKSLEDLNLSHLNLFLIHAPFATQHVTEEDIYPLGLEGNLLLDEAEDILDIVWLKLADLKRRGLVTYIGLSNVNLDQLKRLNKLAQVDVVQNEYHLYNRDCEFLKHCREMDVHFEAYAAFGNPTKSASLGRKTFLTDQLVKKVAGANNLSQAQVIIQWLHKQPLSYVIKCDSPDQIQENLNAIRDITISNKDMIVLDSLNINQRLYGYEIASKHREYPFRVSVKEIANSL